MPFRYPTILILFAVFAGDNDVSDESWKVPPWEGIKWGLIAIGLAGLMFLFISWKEDSGGSMRVHWLVALSYYVGGKWTVGGVFGFIGCFLIGMGVMDLLKKED